MEPSWFPVREHPNRSGSAMVTIVSHPSWIRETNGRKPTRASALSKEAGFHAFLSIIFPEMKKSELVEDIRFRVLLKETETFASLYSPISTGDIQNRVPVGSSSDLSDLEWFASEESALQRFRGKYVAIRERKVIGWGSTPIEAYRMAKHANPNAEPAITFIPETENTLF